MSRTSAHAETGPTTRRLHFNEFWMSRTAQVEWRKDRPAIQASPGSLLIRGCDFRQNQPNISLGPRVDRAVITGNTFAGPAQIQNASTKVVQVGLNAAL